MADNIAVTPGAGATVSTEEITTLNGGGVSAQHVQRVLLAARTSDGVAVDVSVDSSGEQRVLLAQDTFRIAVTSAGLTTATTAYVTGDVMGTLFTLASAARATGGSGRIRSVVLVDELDITNAVDVFFFRGSVTFGTDNSAPSISDADAAQLVAVVPLVNMLDLGGVRVNTAHNLSIPYDCDAGTSLYAGLVTRSGHTFFTSLATALKLVTFVGAGLMAYTVGGATGDDITMTAGASMGTNGQWSLIGGWFYPTTLTANRFLCSRGATTGLQIDAVTTSIRFVTDHTTDGQYTAPAGLVVNQWFWFAVMLSNSNALTPPEAVRMWGADARTPPTELTVTTATTPVGNTVGATAWTVGNRSTGTVAFQGQVAEQFVLSTVTGSLFSQAAGSIGTIVDAQADLVRRHLLTPFWQCRPEDIVSKPWWGLSQVEMSYWPGFIDVGAVAAAYEGQMWTWVGALPGYKPATFGSTAAYSQNHPPYRSLGNWGIPALVME